MEATNKNTAAVKTLKEMIKAEYFEAIELVKYGIQIYNATEGNEYDVITKAEKYNGRYYFITREGRRVAWSSLDSDKLDHACDDFIDNVKRDMTAETSENTTIYHNVTAARVGYLANVIADAVGVAFGSSLPSNDIKFDLQSFYNWQNSNGEATETTDPRDLFFIAIRKQGSEAGTRRHVRERCKVLGRPVYVLRISHEYDTDGRELAGRYRLAVRATTKDPLNNDDTNESKEPERPAANDATNESKQQTTTSNAGAKIINAAAKTVKAAAWFIRRVVGWLLLAVGGFSTFALLVVILNAFAAVFPYTPFLVRLLWIVPALGVAACYEILYIILFAAINRRVELLATFHE